MSENVTYRHENVTYRHATVDDAAEMEKCNLACLPENYPLDNWIAILKHWTRLSMVAEIDGKMVGYILYFVGPVESVDEEPNSIHVASIAVYPEYRRRGIADQLIRQSTEGRPLWASLYPSVTLHVRKSNSAAILLYVRRGFRVTKVVPGYYEDGEDGLFLRKPLV